MTSSINSNNPVPPVPNPNDPSDPLNQNASTAVQVNANEKVTVNATPPATSSVDAASNVNGSEAANQAALLYVEGAQGTGTSTLINQQVLRENLNKQRVSSDLSARRTLSNVNKLI
jgi:putative ribosome biogenesis GTPase RsgA